MRSGHGETCRQWSLGESLSAIGGGYVIVRRYEASHRIAEMRVALAEGEYPVKFGGWDLTVAVRATRLGEGRWRLEAKVKALAGAGSISMGVGVEMMQWSPDCYLMMPGAVYAGNRFDVAAGWEPHHVKNGTPNMVPVISPQVPRLEREPGKLSRIQLLSGDMATPCVAAQDPEAQLGVILLGEQGTEHGNNGVFAEESDDRSRALLMIQAPGVREDVLYMGRPSRDRGAYLPAGGEISLVVDLHIFKAATVNDLFARFVDVRKEMGRRNHRQDIPFSSVWEIQQRKYNTQNWVEEYGYYSVGMQEVPSQDWQTSWVGGLNTTYALLACGDEITQRRAVRTFDFMVETGGTYPSGYLRGCFSKGKWYGDGPYHLQRISADGLYFLVKEFLLLREQGVKVSPRWEQMLRNVADAFCDTWDQCGQFGHRSDPHTKKVAWGETAGAAIACGGLALAAKYLGVQRYMDVAVASAQRYYHEFVCKGILNGAPGDALHAPDCESAFGLLESYITLYELTGDRVWVGYARDAANHCASYVVSYDFAFPAQSTFGKLDMLTTGTMMANAQNKCAVPGICTLSGNTLLKLFRLTGEGKYLELIRDIAHSIPQYMSRADRPICDRRPGQRWPVMDPGWINERVNMGDWEVRGEPDEEIGVGEIFGGSCWCEAAMMLTYAELPGLYVQVDKGLVCAIDHVDAKVAAKGDQGMEIELTNPTSFGASVKIFAEPSDQTGRVLGPVSMLDCPRIDVPARSSARIWVARDGKATPRVPTERVTEFA